MILYKKGFLRNTRHRSIIIATILIIIIGTTVYHFIEGWNWIDSTYFSVMTLTTVGYGDFAPQTNFGKIFTIFYVITGIGLMFSFINTFYQRRVNKIKEHNNKKTEK